MNKDEAIDKVEAANSEWCWSAVHAYRMDFTEPAGTLITSDDVWALCNDQLDIRPREPRAMGAVMRSLHRYGYIKPLNKWQPSARRECHGRPLRVWRTI